MQFPSDCHYLELCVRNLRLPDAYILDHTSEEVCGRPYIRSDRYSGEIHIPIECSGSDSPTVQTNRKAASPGAGTLESCRSDQTVRCLYFGRSVADGELT